VARLLADPVLRVRYEAATALTCAGERAAVPTLVALLNEAPLPLAWQVEDLLFRLAGERGPEVTLGAGGPAERRKCRDTWEAWWKRHGGEADLARLRWGDPLRGLTLACEFDGPAGNGRVCEFGQDGKPRWQVTGLQGPNDAQVLPGGRVLVAERNGNKVTERDRAGKVLWEHAAPSSPIACQRLANGNTLVVTWNELYEVTPDQKKVFTHTHPAGFRHAVRQRNGRIVYVASNGQVGELDAHGKLLRTITPANYATGAGYWASVEPLPNGRFLLALGGAGRVVEIDPSGKVVWECAQSSAVFATRLRNGHTLVASIEGRKVIEYDRTGKEVWSQATQGRPFHVRRR
jgi:hypothetical protein